MKKYAIFVHASQSELAKALHALLYAQELYENNYEVKVIFDGAGTVWIKKFEDSSNPYHPVYKSVKQLGVIEGACEYCSSAFQVKEEVKQSGLTSLGEQNGHPSLNNFVKAGYQIITL